MMTMLGYGGDEDAFKSPFGRQGRMLVLGERMNGNLSGVVCSVWGENWWKPPRGGLLHLDHRGRAAARAVFHHHHSEHHLQTHAAAGRWWPAPGRPLDAMGFWGSGGCGYGGRSALWAWEPSLAWICKAPRIAGCLHPPAARIGAPPARVTRRALLLFPRVVLGTQYTRMQTSCRHRSPRFLLGSTAALHLSKVPLW